METGIDNFDQLGEVLCFFSVFFCSCRIGGLGAVCTDSLFEKLYQKFQVLLCIANHFELKLSDSSVAYGHKCDKEDFYRDLDKKFNVF